MKATRIAVPAAVLLLAALLLAPAPVPAQEEPAAPAQEAAPEAASPLAPFQRLIGGRWEMEGSYQEFEWGVGRKSVRSSSYFVAQGRSKKVSEGFWYWHPGEKEIRGVFVAVDMPVELFEYTTRFEGDKMISRLRSFTGAGDESVFTETFEFSGNDQYKWILYEGDGEAAAVAMAGTFTRK